MKKYTPYVLPLVVLGVVFLLVFRWYNNRPVPSQDQDLFGEGVEIEDLSSAELQRVLNGAGDLESTELAGEAGSSGVVRYEVVDGKVRFSVIANLPESEGTYAVWLRSADGTRLTKAFDLEPGKGGYLGSATAPEDMMPFEVLVSDSLQPEMVVAEPVLSGMVGEMVEETSVDGMDAAEEAGVMSTEYAE